MNRLREKIVVGCSVQQTEARLASYFARLRGNNGIARLRLRVPVVADGFALSIDREVIVEAHQARDDDNLNVITHLSWTPEGSVVFPLFEGTLTVFGESELSTSFIELAGHYKPPFGSAGEAFDAVIGHRIAETTARELLGDLKQAVERD